MENSRNFKCYVMGKGEVLFGVNQKTGDFHIGELQEGKGLPIGSIAEPEYQVDNLKTLCVIPQDDYMFMQNIWGQSVVLETIGHGCIMFPHGYLLVFDPYMDNTESIKVTKEAIEAWVDFGKASKEDSN